MTFSGKAIQEAAAKAATEAVRKGTIADHERGPFIDGYMRGYRVGFFERRPNESRAPAYLPPDGE